MAPFSVIVFWRCSVDDRPIRRKTAPFSFGNGLVWMGSKCVFTGRANKAVLLLLLPIMDQKVCLNLVKKDQLCEF